MEQGGRGKETENGAPAKHFLGMIKSKKEKPKPEGWEEIEPTLSALDAKMREAETVSHEGKRKNETLWPIYQIHYQRSRYIYEMYKEHKISRELYDYCVTQKIVDAPLIAKWKKVRPEASDD